MPCEPGICQQALEDRQRRHERPQQLPIFLEDVPDHHDNPPSRAAGASVVLADLTEFPAWYADHLLASRLADLNARLAELHGPADLVVILGAPEPESAEIAAETVDVPMSALMPTFGGDTIYAWSEVLEKAPLLGRSDVGGLRVRTIAAKDCPCDSWPGKQADGKYHPAVVLDLDYWLLVPRRAASGAAR